MTGSVCPIARAFTRKNSIENRIEFLNKIKNLAPKILIRVPMIKEKLGWLPNYPLRKGMERTYAWIEEMVKREMV